MIFSSGVDMKTMRCSRLADGKWTQIGGNAFHKHDVRAMASYESQEIRMIVSGGINNFMLSLIVGVDRTLSVLSFVEGNENLRVLPPVPQEQVVCLAPEARMLLSWSDNSVRIWKIEEVEEAVLDGEDYIEKRYLLEMNLSVIFYCRKF